MFAAFDLLLVGSGLVPQLHCPSSQIWLGASLLSVQRRLGLCQHWLAGTNLWIMYMAQRKSWIQRCMVKITAVKIEPGSFNDRRKIKSSTPLWAELQ